MKKLALIALAAASTLAFATQPAPSSSPEIVINGKSNQTVISTSSSFTNTADKNAYAVQDVSSNAGNVTVEGMSSQSTYAKGAAVSNWANGDDAYAAQNLASNTGLVTIGKSGMSTQMVSLWGGFVGNRAGSKATAVQNLATNNGCSACQPGDSKPGYGHHD